MGTALYPCTMRNILYLIVGVMFGLALTKGEAISWYRMQEMFHFQGFHMYGIFMTAVPVGAISIWLIQTFNVHTLDGESVVIPEKKFHKGIILGGLIFGFGWALTGACPGPLYALMGGGYSVTLVTFMSALAGTWVFARLEKRMPR
jgi:uncharacterized membrane protein YedE/YeeE